MKYLAMALALTSPVFAENPHQFRIGIEGGYYKYQEPKLMKKSGVMGGINASYFYSPDQYEIGLEGRLLYGVTKYDGNLMNGTPHKQTGVKNWLFEPRFLTGIKISLNNLKIKPFLGIGYRFKSDNLYDIRSSEYFYIPMGMAITIPLNNEWKVSPSLEYDFFLKGIQTSKTLYFKCKNKQKKGYGLKSEILFSHKLSQGKEISFAPYIHYWNIKDSNKIGVFQFHEPKNDTVEVGMKVSYLF